MLKLKNISKQYTTGEFKQTALDEISLEFRKNEFVSILGPSGSGKTTLLNVIGGLDRYDSGELIINNKSTSKFKDKDWDAYRNNCVGFIFQSYNLIGHISVLENVEMGMTLSGMSAKKRKEKALEVLDKVGLKDHAHKKPNQLSGGQMQRVAIARAIANDPDIILADEPTGALDSKTSIQIMELIEDIAKNKLVVMVTHNKDLANKYSTRIVELKDGKIINDSNPINIKDKEKDTYVIKKTSMNFSSALKLSLKNIFTKKGRTILTAFASSIGIIGIALILSLSNGFDIQIDKFQKNTLSSLPIMISSNAMKMDSNAISQMQNQMMGKSEKDAYSNVKKIYPKKSYQEEMTHTNILTSEYVDYVDKLDKKYVSGIGYTRATSINAIVKNNDVFKSFNMSGEMVSPLPKNLDKDSGGMIEDNFDLLAGKNVSNKDELLLMIDSKNGVNTELLKALGIDEKKKEYDFNDLLGREIKVVFNDEFYKETGSFFTINNDLKGMYESPSSLTLKIVGIARGKKDKKQVADGSGLAYSDELINYVIEKNKNSKIVNVQNTKDYNVLTGQKFVIDEEKQETNMMGENNVSNASLTNKETFMSYLGVDSSPLAISIYPKDFDSKDSILKYLDAFNKGKDNNNKILYNDMAELISGLSKNIMDAVTVVLIAFSSISLIVSSIMIGIITYISVLERTKEIGILRALGARKKDISRVFNAETFIIGLSSGIIGILIAWILTLPTNVILQMLTDLPNVAQMNIVHILILVVTSILLTLIGGAIPAKIASKKEPVEALRTE
ncbi:MAG: ATP-binding cassette domain-containing protein [Bacilli bacterium]